MNRPDALLYTISFAAYLLSFLGFIFHVALKRDGLGGAAMWLAGIGLVPHTAAFAFRWISQGHVPLANMYEYMGLMAWMVVASLLFFARRYRNSKIGLFFVPIAVMLLVTASLLPSDINRQLMPALQSSWLVIHVTLAALGSGAFLIAFAASSLYLLAQREPEERVGEDLVKNPVAIACWVGIPLFVMAILNLLGFVPTAVAGVAEARLVGLDGKPFTAFGLGTGKHPLLLGRWAIGLGIGMVVAAVAWPLIHRRAARRPRQATTGAKTFVVVVISLLLSAVIVGFLIRSGFISVTPRSYFKIFEFMGPTLVISWFLFAPMNWLFRKRQGGWIDRLDVATPVLEDIAYAAVSVGYPLYTVGALFAGAIWAEQAWGSWWSWDPKEVGALIIWLFYTGYLHARYQRQWREQRAAILVVLGMVMIFVSFFGNYFFGGLHSFEVS
jgi:ABC-type transport system involved in cytochrome c biogenesis permease subunit